MNDGVDVALFDGKNGGKFKKYWLFFRISVYFSRDFFFEDFDDVAVPRFFVGDDFETELAAEKGREI